MAEDTDKKKADQDFRLAQNKMAVKAAGEAQIGQTAERIMLKAMVDGNAEWGPDMAETARACAVILCGAPSEAPCECP